MTTQRCNTAERDAFKAKRIRGCKGGQIGEPALGTVDERLSIILSRLGATQRIVLSRAERAELESYRVA